MSSVQESAGSPVFKEEMGKPPYMVAIHNGYSDKKSHGVTLFVNYGVRLSEILKHFTGKQSLPSESSHSPSEKEFLILEGELLILIMFFTITTSGGAAGGLHSMYNGLCVLVHDNQLPIVSCTDIAPSNLNFILSVGMGIYITLSKLLKGRGSRGWDWGNWWSSSLLLQSPI